MNSVLCFGRESLTGNWENWISEKCGRDEERCERRVCHWSKFLQTLCSVYSTTVSTKFSKSFPIHLRKKMKLGFVSNSNITAARRLLLLRKRKNPPKMAWRNGTERWQSIPKNSKRTQVRPFKGPVCCCRSALRLPVNPSNATTFNRLCADHPSANEQKRFQLGDFGHDCPAT